jgi:hypothetical protein
MMIEGWHPLQKVNLEKIAKKGITKKIRDWAKFLLDNGLWIAEPPIKARMVAIDYPNYVEKIIGPEVEKWMTHEYVDPRDVAYMNQNRRVIRWKKDSPARGGFLEFLTQMQPIKSHGGSARHVVWVDEEILQDYWSENAMRVISLDGRMLYGATATEGISWTEESIFQKAEQEANDPDNNKYEVYMMEMSTYDNPTNTREVIDKIRNQCVDETDIDIRIHGKRKRKGGLVYSMARDQAPWIIPRFEIPQDKGLLILALDPHPQIPHALLWVWVDYEGLMYPLVNNKPNLYEVGESFEPGTVQAIHIHIEKMEEYLKRQHDYFIVDPIAWNTEQHRPEDTPLAEQLEDYGLLPERASKDRTANILRVSQLLTLQHNDMGNDEYVRSLVNPELILTKYAEARPRLMTFEDLERTRYERRNWHYPTYRNQSLIEHEKIKPKPVDKDDHMMENEGRVVAYIDEYNFDELIQMYDSPRPSRPKIYAPDGKEVLIDWNQNEDKGFNPIKDL